MIKNVFFLMIFCNLSILFLSFYNLVAPVALVGPMSWRGPGGLCGPFLVVKICKIVLAKVAPDKND